ncbi:MAG: J domain-containing protein [Myxococcales bacterium]|nr:J domain-containing protein [Myxococcales bacterium]
MSWSGKALGGLFGALVGGPIGAGVGAAVGHYLGDAGASPDDRPRNPLEVLRLNWVHHVFRAAGPGVEIAPVWVARGLRDRDVTVRMDAADRCEAAVATPEHALEEIEAPIWFIPYSWFGDDEEQATEVVVTLRAGSHDALDRGRFTIPMPRRVRRLGNSGPGRVVMALVACARAGGRVLSVEDREWIRLRFEDGHPLDSSGRLWLGGWMDELSAADVGRLTPAKVGERLATRVDVQAGERIVMWLMHGARAVWPGWAAEQFIGELASTLGLAARLEGLWAQVAREPDPVALLKAVATLGIAAGTPPDEARRAYRALLMRWHPDRARTPADAEGFTRQSAAINAAWAIFAAPR